MQNLPVYIVLLSIVFSFISWAYRKISEKKAIRDQELEIIRRREALLRTGRVSGDDQTVETVGSQIGVPNAAQASARADTQAQAQDARREAQLAEQRRRQRQALQSQQSQEAARSGGRQFGQANVATARGPASQASAQPSGPAGPQAIELWPGGPVVTINSGGAPVITAPQSRTSQPQPQSRPQPSRSPIPARPTTTQRTATTGQSSQRSATQRVAASLTASQRSEQQRREAGPMSNTERAAIAQRREFERTVALRAPTDAEELAQRNAEALAQRLAAIKNRAADIRAGRFATPSSPDEWRQALLAAEVFSTPLGLR